MSMALSSFSYLIFFLLGPMGIKVRQYFIEVIYRSNFIPAFLGLKYGCNLLPFQGEFNVIKITTFF
jgi:hypothetical protein